MPMGREATTQGQFVKRFLRGFLPGYRGYLLENRLLVMLCYLQKRQKQSDSIVEHTAGRHEVSGLCTRRFFFLSKKTETTCSLGIQVRLLKGLKTFWQNLKAQSPVSFHLFACDQTVRLDWSYFRVIIWIPN